MAGVPRRARCGDAIERGDWSSVRERLRRRRGAAHEQRGRPRAGSTAPTRSSRTSPGPGRARSAPGIAQEWPAGVALTLRVGRRRRDRPAALVRAHGRRTAGSTSCGARPRGRPAAPGDARRGAAAAGAPRRGSAPRGVAPLAHGGNSGAALLRATRADGTAFVLKRVAPGADWLARATGDDGRTARLHAAGAFDAMPPAIEHGIVAVERDRGRRLDRHARRPRAAAGGRRAADARAEPPHPRRGRRAARDVPRTGSRTAPRGCATASACPRRRWPTPSGPGPDLLPKQFEHGWEAFAEVVARRRRRRGARARARSRRRSPTRCSPPTAPPRSSTATCATTTSASTATASC